MTKELYHICCIHVTDLYFPTLYAENKDIQESEKEPPNVPFLSDPPYLLVTLP